MAAAGNRWEETKEGVEHFHEGKHLQSHGWDRASSYIPDSRVYDKVYDSKPGHVSPRRFPRCHLRVKSLIHATTPEAAAAIIKSGGMTSTFKGLNDDNVGLRLIWWGIALEKKDIVTYIEKCRTYFTNGMVRKKDSHDDSERITKHLEKLKLDESDITNRLTNFCSSAPFDSTSRYGNIVFEYSIEELLHEYSSQFCDGKDPILLVMGTFAYKQEVMHAILVSHTRNFEPFEFSPLSEEARVIYKKDGDWIWSPETTTHKSYHSWEHATFAFLIPEGQVFELENLDMHTSYCAPADEAVFRKHTSQVKDRKPWSVYEILNDFYNDNIMKPNQLLSIIHKHLVKILQPSGKETTEEREGGNTNCPDCTDFVKIKPRFLQTLLGGSIENKTRKSYCPHELLQIVGNPDPASCAQRWHLWIREMTHYLPRE